MKRRSDVRFEVDGRGHRLVLTRGEDSLTVECEAEDDPDMPLGAVVSSFWTNHSKQVLESIRARTGMSLEGDVSFGYHEEYPEELPPGVTVREFERSATVPAAFFARYVVEYALAYMKAAAEVGIEEHEDLRPELLALRERCAKIDG